MLFGQSIFQSVVTRLTEERSEDELPETGDSFHVRGLTSGFVASTDEPATIGTGTEAYFAFLHDKADIPASILAEPKAPAPPPQGPAPLPKAPPKPAVPVHLLRLSPGEITEELAISETDSEAMLNDKRRRFAKTNHPDSVAPEFRDKATIRMTIANLQIDQAIKNRTIRDRLLPR
jgi:hypothetical protein